MKRQKRKRQNYFLWCFKHRLNPLSKDNRELFFLKDDMGFIFEDLYDLLENGLLNDRQIKALED